MKPFKLILTGFVMLFFLAAVVPAPAQSGLGNDGQGGPRLRCQERFDTLDANHDGKLTKEEFMAAPHRRCDPEQAFNAMDPNGHGFVTKEEFCAVKRMGGGCPGMGQQGRGAGQSQ